jgi:hypothetical protein
LSTTRSRFGLGEPGSSKQFETLSFPFFFLYIEGAKCSVNEVFSNFEHKKVLKMARKIGLGDQLFAGNPNLQ